VHSGRELSTALITLSVLCLIVVTTGAIALRNRAPYLLAGWLWYLGMLVPVIGLVQVGNQAHADRYTYLPQIGVLIAVCWGIADLAKARERIALGAAVSAALVLSILTWSQQSIWSDSITLWKHTTAVEPNNPLAWYNLGSALQERSLQRSGADKQADLRAAADSYGKAVELRPTYGQAQLSLGYVFQNLGRWNDAIQHYEAYYMLNPNAFEARSYLAGAYCQLGNAAIGNQNLDTATKYFQAAIGVWPHSAEAHFWLGFVNLNRQRADLAIVELKKAIECDPKRPQPHVLLGKVHQSLNEQDAAADEFERAARLAPGDAQIWSELGRARTSQQRWVDAANCHARALQLRPGSAPLRKEFESALDALEKAGGGQLAQDLKRRFLGSGSAERSPQPARVEND